MPGPLAVLFSLLLRLGLWLLTVGPLAPAADAPAEPAADVPPAAAEALPPYRLVDFPGVGGEPVDEATERQLAVWREAGFFPPGQILWEKLGGADRRLVLSAHARGDGGGDRRALSEDVARLAKNPQLRALALADVADRAAEAGDLPAAVGAAERAVPLTPEGLFRAKARIRLADLLVASGDAAAAREVLKRIPSSRPGPAAPGTAVSTQLMMNYDRAAALVRAGAPAEAAQVWLSHPPEERRGVDARQYLDQGGVLLSGGLYAADPDLAARTHLEMLGKVPAVVRPIDFEHVAVLMERHGVEPATVAEVRLTVIDRFPATEAAGRSARNLAEAAERANDGANALQYLRKLAENPGARPSDRNFAERQLRIRGQIPPNLDPLAPRPDPAFPAGAPDGE